MKKKITLALMLLIIIGIWLAPDHGPVIETINSTDEAKYATEDVMVYKPWKEEDIIKEIQDRKELLNEVPNTMTVHLYYICKHHEYKTIEITYQSPGSLADPECFHS